MKILVLQDYLRSGGTERQSILLARAFAAAGHPTTLLTFRPGGSLAGELSGVCHHSLLPFDLHLDWFAPRLLRTVAAAAPDIALCMGRMANCYAGLFISTVPVRRSSARCGQASPCLSSFAARCAGCGTSSPIVMPPNRR